MNSKPDLVVDWCSYKAAKYAVEHWHYSGSMPTPPVLKLGVWEGGKFIGCVLLSRGANKNLGKAYSLSSIQVCELTRVALDNHDVFTSRIVAICIKILKAKEGGLRLIYSYADPNHGHDGRIYQAMNWIYLGETPPTNLFKDKSGRVWHPRQVSKTGVKPQYGELRAVAKIDDCVKIPQLGKHRYLYPLDRAMRRQIAPLAQPYPKKLDMRSVNGDNSVTSGAGRFDPDRGAY